MAAISHKQKSSNDQVEKDNLRSTVTPSTLFVVASATQPLVEFAATENHSDAVAVTQIETERYTIGPAYVASSRVNGDRQKSLINLLELIHYQQLDLVIEARDKVAEKLIAAFDLIKWDDLNLAKTAVQKAIVRAELFLDSELRTQLSIVRQRDDGKWNLILTLLLECPLEKGKTNLKRAQQVGSAVLSGLHDDRKERSTSLNFGALTRHEEEAVQDVARETLCESGGHVWKKPMAIVIEDEIALTLHGRMAAKPDHKNYVPEKVILEGKCRGFVNDHKQRALLFSINEANCVEIGFTEEQVHLQRIDLLKIAALNMRGTFCKVTTSKTTDARGKHVYEFVSMEADDPEPDLLTESSDVIMNSDAATSTTHSNES